MGGRAGAFRNSPWSVLFALCFSAQALAGPESDPNVNGAGQQFLTGQPDPRGQSPHMRLPPFQAPLRLPLLNLG